MNALVTFLQRRRYKNRRRGQRSPSPEYTNPSVTITSSFSSPGAGAADDGGERHLNRHQNNELSFLHQLCKRWAWPAVVFRIEEFPNEVTLQQDNGHGDTMLHWACFGSPPVEVVEALLQANPKLAQIPNHLGNLPLHVACSYRASSSIIRELLRAYPESVNVHNSQGSCPLHILCDYGCQLDSIQAALEISIKSVFWEDGLYCRKPLLILNERKNMHEFHDSLHTLRMANALGSGYQNSATPTLNKDTLLDRCRRMVFWKKACLLILAEHTNKTLTPLPIEDAVEDYEARGEDSSFDNESSSTTNLGIINACLQIQDCPPALLEFAVLVQAEEELLFPTGEGLVPLHLAVNQCNITTILDICHAQPKAARLSNPINGKFPLRSVLERFPNSKWAGVIDQILPANPVALHSLPNVDKRFYSAIFAKLVSKKDFDTIYESIRGNPPLLFGETRR